MEICQTHFVRGSQLSPNNPAVPGTNETFPRRVSERVLLTAPRKSGHFRERL